LVPDSFTGHHQSDRNIDSDQVEYNEQEEHDQEEEFEGEVKKCQVRRKRGKYPNRHRIE